MNDYEYAYAYCILKLYGDVCLCDGTKYAKKKNIYNIALGHLLLQFLSCKTKLMQIIVYKI